MLFCKDQIHRLWTIDIDRRYNMVESQIIAGGIDCIGKQEGVRVERTDVD